MTQAFPDRKCSNPHCRTPERGLKSHEQFGPGDAPVCWPCWSDPPQPDNQAAVPKPWNGSFDGFRNELSESTLISSAR